MESLLDDLKDERASIINAMTSGHGWSDDHVQALANTHIAILAVEAQMSEPPPPTSSGPRIEFGPDGWPK